MKEELKVKRSYAIPENEMVIIKDTNTLLHNIVDSELKEKDKEIERLNNIINELEIDSICGYYKPKSDDSDYLEGYDDGARLTAKFFHNKIKELKGSDKE